jgi:rSAM/selenodomain-associated transferase 2
LTAPLVSVVVPVLDESSTVVEALDRLAELPGHFEVIVVDGGSRDGTAELAEQHPSHPRVLRTRRGRARQQNAGALAGAGEVLVFLHADTRLPRSAYASLIGALCDPRLLGGNFALRFDGADRFARVLGRWYAAQRRLGVYYGDSAVWTRASTFATLGGFRRLEIMEDYDFVRRLERLGRTVCLAGPAVTSGRRWRALGAGRTVFSWVLIRWLWLAGVPDRRLVRLYRQVR